MEKNLINVIILGLSFMFLFTSFQTGGFIQGPMIESINKEYEDEGKKYGANTYISMCIIYFMLSVANWLAPAFVHYFGPKLSMIMSGTTYIIFIANFLWPQAWLLYIVSAIVGLGAAVIWNAQGYYLTLCTTEQTSARNSGIFWTLLQCSLLFGNIFVYVYFSDKIESNDIPRSTRIVTYIVLSVVGSLGIVTFFFLGIPESQKSPEESEPSSIDIIGSIKQSFSLMLTRRMALLCVTFWYTGIELSFFSGVYTTALGKMSSLDPEGHAKKYVGLAGMLIGLGEIFGGLLFGILGSKTIRWGRDPIVIMGYFIHMLAFFLIFLNFSPDSVDVDSHTVQESAFIKPSLAIALICSFLLGFGDACYNTQCYSILCTLYADDSAPAFALFKFTQSMACAFAFFYTPLSNLYVQLAILALFASIGTMTYSMVEWELRKDNRIENPDRVHQN